MKRVVLGWQHPFSPYKHISQVPITEIRTQFLAIFQEWGKPGSMRVDNGEPLGSPNTDTTPDLALWCILHDIDMIWNKPHCPQMNGVVEKMQDTSQRWAEIDKALNIEDLQQRLDQEAHIQRAQFKVTRLGNKTRLIAYPELISAQRTWQTEAENKADIKRVYQFLAKKTYARKVSSAGQINIFAQKLSAAKAFKDLKGLYVQVKLNPETSAWDIYYAYKLIKSFLAKEMNRQNVENLSVMSKNKSSIT